MSAQPTETTHGLKCGGFVVNLAGAPFPVAATHDPAKAMGRVAISPSDGVGTRPTAMPAHSNETLPIRIELDEIPRAQFLALQAVETQASKGSTLSYSPLGEDSYTSSGWTLISSTAGWVETRFGMWRGVVELAKKGAAL